jgi:hypothetical protein
MHLSLRSARRATATAMTVALAAAGLLTSACTPQVAGDKVLSGTIQGADGKIVDVYVGFDVLDSAGNKINLGGGSGYSAVQRLNHCVGTAGASKSQTCPTTGYVTSRKWSIILPPNAATVYIEVYPKAANSFDWYNGAPAGGSTNLSTYGETYRRAIPMNGNMFIPIVLPLVCGVSGGSTGTLAGHISGWPQGQTGTVNAWSMASNTLATQGFAAGTPIDGNGNYSIAHLQSGQRYGLIASGPGFYRYEVNYTNSTTNATLVPGACKTKTYNF